MTGQRVVFMGTPDFAVPCLEAIVAAGYEVCGVVSQPDRPKGRGKKLCPSPVKQAALQISDILALQHAHTIVVVEVSDDGRT